MDFFAQQDRSRRKTKLLVFYFILAVATIILACYFVGVVVFNAAQSQHPHYGEQPQLVLWDIRLFFGVTVGGSGTATLVATTRWPTLVE